MHQGQNCTEAGSSPVIYSLYVLPRRPGQGAVTLSQLPAPLVWVCHCHLRGLTHWGPVPGPAHWRVSPFSQLLLKLRDQETLVA